MKELIEKVADALGRAYEHAQGLELQSSRGNVMHLAGCLAAMEEAMGALQGIGVPEDREVTEDV